MQLQQRIIQVKLNWSELKENVSFTTSDYTSHHIAPLNL